MVNNVGYIDGFAGSNYYRDYKNLANFLVGSNIAANEAGPFDGMGLMLGITGALEVPKVIGWFKGAKAKGGVGSAWALEKEAIKADFEYKKGLFANGGWQKGDTYKTLWDKYSLKTVEDAIPTEENLKKLSPETQTLYTEVRKNIKKSNVKDASEILAKANAQAHTEMANIKPEKFWGKLGKGIQKYTGFTKASGWMKNLALTSPTTEKLLRFGKGNGLFLIAGGIMELFQIIPTFAKLGAEKGLVQTGKSAIKTGASVGGWVAGAAAGAAIGSVIPGAGTLVGGIIGGLCSVVGGSIGSWAAGKVTKAVIGKDELELEKEKEARELAGQASQSPEVAQQLMLKAQQKIQTEGAGSEDAKIAYNSLNNINKSSQGQSQSIASQYAPSMKGNYSFNPFSPENTEKDYMSTMLGLA